MEFGLSRRGFFKGVVATVSASSIVVEASPDEVQKFSKGTLIEGQEINKNKPVSDEAMIYIKSREGGYVPFGYVDDIMFKRDVMDITAFGDETRHYRPMHLQWEGHFIGYGPCVRDFNPEGVWQNGYPTMIDGPSFWAKHLERNYPDYRR
jgi:hypothetical protein